MKLYRLLALSVLATMMSVACSEDAPVGDPSLGSINPDVYVAIGNGLTAGYQSGALFEEAQLYSYPNIIAQQIGTPQFVQPLIPFPGTGELMVLRQIAPSLIITRGEAMIEAPENATHPAPYNNLGIPGAVMADAIDESDIQQRAAQRGNPFYPLIMRDQDTFGKSLIAQAIRLQPTLITFWLGTNDVVAYAASGGTRGSDQTGKRPTDPQNFEFYLATAMDLLKANLPEAEVLIGNIPDVTAYPLFNTVPRKIPSPLNPSQLLDVYYTTNDQQKAVVGPDDYILLTAQTQLAQGVGIDPANPLPSQYVLDASEVQIAQDAVAAFNAAIDRQANAHGYTVVDMHALIMQLGDDGISIAGETYTNEYIAGGVFSLDGVHLMQRGNVLVANEFIEAMNRAHGANIRMAATNDVPGLPAPTGVGKRRAGTDWSSGMRFPDVDIARVAAYW